MDTAIESAAPGQVSARDVLAGVKSGKSGSMSRANLISVFDSFLAHGRDIAVIEKRGYRRKTTTYEELHRSAMGWSQRFAERGVQPGDRVLLWGPNSGAWVGCFWALLLVGAIAVPMDTGASSDFVERTVRSAKVKLILR